MQAFWADAACIHFHRVVFLNEIITSICQDFGRSGLPGVDDSRTSCYCHRNSMAGGYFGSRNCFHRTGFGIRCRSRESNVGRIGCGSYCSGKRCILD